MLTVLKKWNYTYCSEEMKIHVYHSEEMKLYVNRSKEMKLYVNRSEEMKLYVNRSEEMKLHVLFWRNEITFSVLKKWNYILSIKTLLFRRNVHHLLSLSSSMPRSSSSSPEMKQFSLRGSYTKKLLRWSIGRGLYLSQKLNFL